MNKNNPKILFNTSGSFELGFGHIRRSLSIAEAMVKSLSRDNIIFCCKCQKEDTKEIFYPYRVFLNPSEEEMLDYIASFNINILVADGVDDNINTYLRFKKASPKLTIVALDYFNYDNTYINIIINLFNHNPKVKSPVEEFKGKYYEGLEYAIIRESFLKYICLQKRINSSVSNVLITFGGSDKNNNTIKALSLLDAVGYKGNVDIIVGPLFRSKKEILSLIRKKKHTCCVYENLNDIEKYIFAADLGFTGAGTTLLEFCSLGTPAVIMPQTDREYRFAKYFAENKAAVLLELEGNNKPIVERLISNSRLREEISERGRELIDGQGKERIANIILGRHL